MHHFKLIRHHGFTIVELLVVIVVIAILGTIITVTYNGSQLKSRNTAKYAEIKALEELFGIYRAMNGGVYPSMANGGYCLGSNFPDTTGDGVGDCRDIYYAPTRYTTNTTLLTALQGGGALPNSNLRQSVNGTLGPYAEYNTSDISLIATMEYTTDGCPSGLKSFWTDGSKLMLCGYTLTK